MSQIDFIVPSSDTPRKREWSIHYWYVMFASALQADEKMSDEDAELLIQSFRSLQVSLCCPTCRTHYRTYFAETPYTPEHARNVVLSVEWVKTLRLFIQNRVRKEETARNGDIEHRFKTDNGGCSLPGYPGVLFKQQTCIEYQDAEDLERLNRAIHKALVEKAENATRGEPCACAMEDMQFEPPKWNMSKLRPA